MPRTEWGWQVTSEELAGWVIEDCEKWIAINKPAHVVCHPSKHGPWSSLIGAAREFLGVDRLHMPFRLDRETSGVVVFAKDAGTGAHMQRLVNRRQSHKRYVAVLTGELRDEVLVDAPIGRHPSSEVRVRRGVVESGFPARTLFTPMKVANGYSLVEVKTYTGRLHQIRVHAAHIGHALVGDKLYGPDERLFLEFLENGWTERHAQLIELPRQALHCVEAGFDGGPSFQAPMAADMVEFCKTKGLT